MKQKTSVALVGIGGYGQIYVSPLIDPAQAEPHGAQLVAAVDPNPAACKHLPALQAGDVPIYPTTADLYAHHRPDVVVIASPIQFHARQTIEALSHGAHVLCEKPLCGSVEQARDMRLAQERSGRQVAIGYQWSFSEAIGRLKADIMAGAFGAPRRCKSLALWPRDEVYYTRNGWAGRLMTRSGEPVLDSPINNACAHFLHNLLYLLGTRVDRSAAPVTVQAELYRAHTIETFDTAALRCRLAGDVELLFVVSHATAELREPAFVLEFDRATITYGGEKGGRLIARYQDGTERDYGRPSGSSDANKLWTSIESFNANTPVVCGIEAATPQTLVVCAAHASMREPVIFPPSLVHVSGDMGKRKTFVDGLGAVLTDCYDQWLLPSELRADWARRSSTVRVADLVSSTHPAPGVQAPEVAYVPA